MGTRMKSSREVDVRDTTRTRLEAVFRAALELPAGVDVQRSSQADEPRWDSLAHVVLMGAIESEFALPIDTADSLELTSYAQVATFLEARGL
jgi:acyl carrier protein